MSHLSVNSTRACTGNTANKQPMSKRWQTRKYHLILTYSGVWKHLLLFWGQQFKRRLLRHSDRDTRARMCGEDVDLDDGGSGDEEKEQEFWVGEGVKMLPPPLAHSEGSAWGSRRGRCGCVACGAGLLLWNVGVVLVCVLVLMAVFTLVLLPASLLLYVGFLCHSRVLDSHSPFCRYLDDNSCSALIILGFVMMSPLVVVAAAIFCGLLRRLRLLLLFQPITRAWYRGPGLDWGGDVLAWV
ncbi:transmembrane protein 88B-like isoform X2 [Oncorhynchus masou masou]|uniref:transmembrane protein 88B-like isoform X2 n=1 Tax=Oncorhynchus masou masou TaxID=90313 RepID=UPI003183F0A8